MIMSICDFNYRPVCLIICAISILAMIQILISVPLIEFQVGDSAFLLW